MIQSVVGGLCFVGASAAFVWWRLLKMQIEVGHMVERLKQEGADPDVTFLRAIAEIQAEERGRWRSPVRWASIRYVQWSRRIWVP